MQNKIMQTKNISKSFGGVKALDSTDIEIEQGKITAIIGPNGAGKSTLFEIISGLQTPDKGQIYFQSKNITNKPAHQIANSGIARTFQHVRLFKNLSLEKHIEFAVNNDDEKFFKNIFGNTKIKSEKTRTALDKVMLDKNENTFAHNLSYGQRKLLDLAIALAKPHELLMLDEPVAGVTPKIREEIKKILLKEKKEGKTILLIEHNMPFVMSIADVVCVLSQGKVIAKGKPKEVMHNKEVLEAYLGE